MSETTEPQAEATTMPTEAPAKVQPGKQYRSAWQSKTKSASPKDSGPRPEYKQGKPQDLTPKEFSAPRLREIDAEVERELQEMLGSVSDADLYGPVPAQAKKGEAPAEPGRKKGKVMALHGPDVFVEVPGGRGQGVLPMMQFPDGPPEIGTEVDVSIEGYDAQNGLLILTRLGAAVHVDWSSVATGMIVEARVTATNKGGLEVEVNGIRGFMPISQIDLYRVENTEQYVNQKLNCMVSEVNPAERNLVVSRRDLLEKEREAAREKLWLELAEGQIREGIVRSIKDFGAFVDLGGADGLLHVSEMSWARVQKAEAMVQPGQKIKVVVLKIDHERRKLSLGLKQLLTSPWDTAEANYPQGTVVKGKVTRLMEFGAFVELEPGVEGLVHISELATHRVRRPGDVVQPDQEVQVAVRNVDKQARRISLSLKAALPKAEDAPEEEDTEEEVQEVRPERIRTTPLRGGLGGG